MFNYKWYLKNGYPDKEIKKHGLKVYTTFACGGGSSMGYKLAGFNVIGANDIDPQMQKIYITNHRPKYFDFCPINELLEKDLPEEYYNLDILDGSPPCSTFFIAGSREKSWKKDKNFREGQAKQVLSDLFFDWIKLVDKLKPKVAIAENVKGMILGNAKAYTKQIIIELNKIGYDVQLFLLNSSNFGVPQRRERVFFICKRKDLNLPNLELNIKLKPINFKEVEENCKNSIGKKLTSTYDYLWKNTPIGKSFSVAHPKGSFFNSIKVSPFKVIPTITASTGGKMAHYEFPNDISDEVLTLCGSFPLDYNFMDLKPKYIIGMSVPPVMMAYIAHEIYLQLFKK